MTTESFAQHRIGMSAATREAMALLDRVAEGHPTPAYAIDHALRMTGDIPNWRASVMHAPIVRTEAACR